MYQFSIRRRLLGVCLGLAALAGCAEPQEEMIGGVPASQVVEGYGVLEDGDYVLPPIPPQFLTDINQRAVVEYNGPEAAGTIVVDPHAKLLYFVEKDGMARRYAIAVGAQGMRMSRPSVISMKREWPSWTPTQNMLRREPKVYGPFARGVEGGLANPLGSRALYLFQNGRDTHFRIHGTNHLESIGNSGSAGCIRMFNHDIIDLYERVPMGTRVVVRTKSASIALEGEELANRGVFLEPLIVDPDSVYGADEDGAAGDTPEETTAEDPADSEALEEAEEAEEIAEGEDATLEG